MDSRASRVSEFLRSLYPETNLEGAFGGSLAERKASLEKLEAPPEKLRDAVAGLETVMLGGTPEGAPLAALEAIILKDECPTVEILQDRLVLDGPLVRWKRLKTDAAWLQDEGFVKASGRIDCGRLPAGYAGTGFLVGENRVMTNRHVALMIAQGLGTSGLRLMYESVVDFCHEKRDPFRTETIVVKKVLLIHPYWDVAILEVEGMKGRKPLVLAAEPPGELAQREVAVIGYPYFRFATSEYERQVLLDNFGDTPGYKRMQPGRLTGRTLYVPEASEPWPKVEALGHNASTLGGNSGSLVVDLNTRRVVGVHFAGEAFKTNWAVPTWELFRDTRVRDAGVLFTTDVAKTPAPAPDSKVEDAWKNARGSANPVEFISVEGTGATPLRSSANAERAPDPNWSANLRVEALELALREAPSTTRKHLERNFGLEQAQQIMQSIEASQAERNAESPDGFDPSLPEIVLVHGILGGHLDDVAAASRRAWLSPWTFLRGGIAAQLLLTPQGDTDAKAGQRLEPAGLFQPVYFTPALAWRKAGFVVHEFSFDWRKRIEIAADRLHFFLEGLSAERPRSFALVGHSMGGLVACVYAQRHASWQQRVQRAVFMGTPLRGSFAPVEAAIGEYPILKKAALISIGDSDDDLARMGRSFPGLIQMLPDPQLFPSAAQLFAAGGWPSYARPSQAFLDQARNLQALVRNSPLLDRTGIVACKSRKTVDTLLPGDATNRFVIGPRNGPGDGTVPIRAAAVEGLPLALVDEEHMLLPCNRDVQEAVASLLRQGVFPERLVGAPDKLDHESRLGTPANESVVMPEDMRANAQIEAARKRMSDDFDFEMLRWLFDNSAPLMPPMGV